MTRMSYKRNDGNYNQHKKTDTAIMKTYMKPTVTVVALCGRQQMLTVSGEISGYGKSASGFSQDDDV